MRHRLVDREDAVRAPLLVMIDQEGKHGQYIVSGHPCLLLAEGGMGKTFAATSLSFAVGTGGKWLGQESGLYIEEPMGVLFIAAEEPAEELHRRMYWLGQSMKLSTDELDMAKRNIIPFGGMGKNLRLLEIANVGGDALRESAVLNQIRDLLNKPHPAGVPWGAVIMDPAARLMPRKAETDPDIATEFCQALETLCETNDHPAVIVAHHTNKASRGTRAGPEDER